MIRFAPSMFAAFMALAILAATIAPAQAFIWGGDGPSASTPDRDTRGVSTMDLGSGR